MQWIQDPSQINAHNLNNVRRNASRHFRNKKKAYLRATIEELETNSKTNNIRDLYRGINDMKKGYQPTTKIVKDEKGDVVADSHSVMARWRNYFSQILNVHGFSDVRQAEIHTAGLQVPEPSVLEVEHAIEKLKSHKSPGSDQIPEELIKARGGTIRCAIYKLIIAIWNKVELPGEWKDSIIVPIHKKGDKRDCNNYRGIPLLPTTYKVLSNILLSRLIMRRKLLGIINVDSDATGRLLIIYSAFVKYCRKNGNTMKQCISSLETLRKLMIQLGRRSCIIFSLSLGFPRNW